MKKTIQNERFLILGGVGTVKGRIREAGPALVAVCDELDSELISSRFRIEAPFEKIDGIIRFGLSNTLGPNIGSIEDGVLPFSIELDMSPLRFAERAVVTRVFKIAIIESLIQIGLLYKLPIERLIELRSELNVV